MGKPVFHSHRYVTIEWVGLGCRFVLVRGEVEMVKSFEEEDRLEFVEANITCKPLESMNK